MVFSGDGILTGLERELKSEQGNSGILSEGGKKNLQGENNCPVILEGFPMGM